MENKIIFLIIAILGLYLLFSAKGQQIVKNIIGVAQGSNTVKPTEIPKADVKDKKNTLSGDLPVMG